MIKIDKSRLTDAPYSAETKGAFLFENTDDINQLVSALKHAHPSAYLISGYRGTGKTSFVNKVVEELQTEFLCIPMNLTKYEGYPRFVKKLIRQLFLVYHSSSQAKQANQLKLDKQLQDLYDRTFNDIVNSKLVQNRYEHKLETKLEVDWKKLLPYFLILLAVIGLPFDGFSKLIDLLMLIGGVLWAAVEWKSTETDAEIGSSSDEWSWKSLYDDEIAEHHLLSILAELKNKGIKVLIIFDELDKIEKKEELNVLFNDIKPLLLSGLCNSLVVSGQSMFYDYEQSHYEDDKVINTLFSRMIHVPFFKNAALKKFCFGLLVEEADQQKPEAELFFNSLILKSGRIPRKLINLISAKLKWQDDQALIDLSLEDLDKLQRNTKLLGVLVIAMDNDLPALTDNPVQLDFFISQLHLWVLKMQSFTQGYFKRDAIIKEDSYKTYPELYQVRLRSVWDLLTDRLEEAGFLKIRNPDPEELPDEYLWIGLPESKEIVSDGNAPTSTDRPENVQTSPSHEEDSNVLEQPVFIERFNDLEAYVKELYESIEPQSDGFNELTLRELLTRMTDIGVLKKKWFSSSKITQLLNTRNKVAHNDKLNKVELDLIGRYQFELSRLRAEINEDFTYFVTRGFFEEYRFYQANATGFDFMAEKDNHQIVFEVKSIVAGKPDGRNVSELLDKYGNFHNQTAKDTYYVLFFYLSNRRKSHDEFYDQFYQRVAQAGYTFKTHMHLFYISEADSRGVKGTIEHSLTSLREHIQRGNKDQNHL